MNQETRMFTSTAEKIEAWVVIAVCLATAALIIYLMLNVWVPHFRNGTLLRHEYIPGAIFSGFVIFWGCMGLRLAQGIYLELASKKPSSRRLP